MVGKEDELDFLDPEVNPDELETQEVPVEGENPVKLVEEGLRVLLL